MSIIFSYFCSENQVITKNYHHAQLLCKDTKVERNDKIFDISETSIFMSAANKYTKVERNDKIY